jgi:hypothetical protein
MPTPSTAGWLPITIGFDAHTTAVSDPPVRWIELDSAPLAAPFLDLDIMRLRCATPGAREVETDLATLLRVAARQAAVRPAGFIFHLSRCGATVVGSALRTAERALVLGEPQPPTSILLPQGYRMGPHVRDRWNHTSRELLNALFTVYAHCRGEAAQPLVINLPSISTLCFPLVRAWWPDVPCLFLIRDPVEVMVANLQGNRNFGWMVLKQAPDRVRELFGWPDPPARIAAMSDEEFGARVLAQFMQSALEAIDGGGCMILDHENLTPSHLREVAAFFSLKLPAADAPLLAALHSHIKDSAGRRKYQDDREIKRKSAPRPLREAAQTWAMPPYFDLRAR